MIVNKYTYFAINQYETLFVIDSKKGLIFYLILSSVEVSYNKKLIEIIDPDIDSGKRSENYIEESGNLIL